MTSRSYLSKMNSILGSVVPLAMFAINTHEDSPPKVARMKVQVHIEWMEELDAWGKRLQVEVKEVQTELAEISRLNAEHEEANDVLWKELEELEVLEK